MTMKRTLLRNGLPALLAATACAQGTGGEAPAIPVIEVDAGDYHFLAPDTLVDGLVTLRARNTGTEVHHVQLVRLDSGRTFAEFATALRGGPTVEWVREVGGVGAFAPGESAGVTLRLERGRYALICLIPGPDGVPHFAKGMMRALEVVSGGRRPAAEPVADLVMVLDDYRYELSAALRLGPQTIEVTNAAAQPHEVVLAKLVPGHTIQELLAWLAGGGVGPAAGRLLGGTVGLARGERNWITVDLARGTYVLLCFFPDRGDGRSHLEHGMIREITVE